MGTSLILPAYVPNRELLEVTKTCLESILATTVRTQYDLIVIDNGSTEDAAEVLKDAADTYIRYEEPFGYARAANIGLALRRQPWTCVLNTDIEFTHKGWLEQFRHWYDNSKTKGGILSAIDDGRKPANHDDSLVFNESWFSCWFTHESVIETVGYFDESLPYRFHDQDYAIRVKRAGYEVMRLKRVQVKHIDSATYNVMDRNDDPEEAAEMRRRWGAVDYRDWIRKGQPARA